MSDLNVADEGQSPLTADNIAGLVPKWVTLRRELNEVEQANIATATRWCFASRTKRAMSEEFANRLHSRMFDKVWRWAGNYRTADTNIGVHFYEVPIEVRTLFGDVQTWIEHNTYPPIEFAVRLKHRLVSIHPYPNGNGRHSRMMGDVALYILSGTTFSWGQKRRDAGESEQQVRAAYIAALGRADNHDLTALIEFAQS